MSDEIDLEYYATGKIGAIKQLLWNQAGTWPKDMNNKTENPHGRPINYWVPTINGVGIGWEGISGWATKEKAKEIAVKFQEKCKEKLKTV